MFLCLYCKGKQNSNKIMQNINVISTYTIQDINAIFSKYYKNGFIFTVANDGTAGVNIPKSEDIKLAKERFKNLGFEIVKEKHLIINQRKNFDFCVYYSVIKKLTDEEISHAEEQLLQRFDSVQIKRSGSVQATLTTNGNIMNYVDEQSLIDFLKGLGCRTIKLIKRKPEESKFLFTWENK